MSSLRDTFSPNSPTWGKKSPQAESTGADVAALIGQPMAWGLAIRDYQTIR